MKLKAVSVPKYHCLWSTKNAFHFTDGSKCSLTATSVLLLAKENLIVDVFFNCTILKVLPAHLLQGLNFYFVVYQLAESSLQNLHCRIFTNTQIPWDTHHQIKMASLKRSALMPMCVFMSIQMCMC